MNVYFPDCGINYNLYINFFPLKKLRDDCFINTENFSNWVWICDFKQKNIRGKRKQDEKNEF